MSQEAQKGLSRRGRALQNDRFCDRTGRQRRKKASNPPPNREGDCPRFLVSKSDGTRPIRPTCKLRGGECERNCARANSSSKQSITPRVDDAPNPALALGAKISPPGPAPLDGIGCERYPGPLGCKPSKLMIAITNPINPGKPGLQ
jgi:hypothetical protein